ncbi:TPA: hypothetical protein VC054_000613 [Streptococcus pyogenes]|uniref:plasmid mobilization protein n=1 Tax=Anaerococcus TaxID=165779 RepID=UPI0027B971F3|nr:MULTISPECIES: hypothetical protein [Anaerococcus]HEP5499427.1 hypothetical protein [Streptococcus pyogenes]MDU1316334.1 hypothetical protein [Anaerococcus hydrogenalis]HEP5949367.1 hypothetical protein [Streptococcus pyogenes]HES2417045.1 hypothetical protein [Streptococcus pyogenes]HES2437595.1 hypothetical protein [Streptococcus pyogenes]
MFRRHSLDEISKKTRNKDKNRKRNRILNFRVSEEEYDLINKKIEISGLKKQDYFLQMLLNHEVKLVSDYRLSDNIAKEIFQLAKVIKKFGKLNDDEADILIYILEIYEEIKKEKSPYYKE